MKLKRCRLTEKQQDRLVEFFVGEMTARTAADLVGINKTTGAYFFHRLREIIAWQLDEAWPLAGEGLNPLPPHFGMFFHPPALMAGLIGITVPFAFALGSQLAGKTGDEWVDTGRVWGIISWVLLASGLLLGSWWAYTILGWGGFWFWDPVENAAFMSWLSITAFILSIMVQQRRGMLQKWNIMLLDVAFGLSR